MKFLSTFVNDPYPSFIDIMFNEEFNFLYAIIILDGLISVSEFFQKYNKFIVHKQNSNTNSRKGYDIIMD